MAKIKWQVPVSGTYHYIMVVTYLTRYANNKCVTFTMWSMWKNVASHLLSSLLTKDKHQWLEAQFSKETCHTYSWKEKHSLQWGNLLHPKTARLIYTANNPHRVAFIPSNYNFIQNIVLLYPVYNIFNCTVIFYWEILKICYFKEVCS